LEAFVTAVVVPYHFVPPVNGGHKAAYGLCQFLSEKRRVIAYSTRDNQPESAPFELRRLLPASISKYFSPLAARSIYRSFKKEQVTLCITHQPFIALLMLPVCRLRGIPLHIYAQNLEYARFKTMGKKWWPLIFMIEWFTFRMADHLYFISPDEVAPGRRAFGLSAERCSILPYGTPHQAPPADTKVARQQVRAQHGFSEEEFLIIFFGPQTYQPNLEAVELIIQHINPLLREQVDFRYRFIICGGGLPAHYQQLEAYPEVSYLGFVQDIEAYVKASDMMINPVNSGGGVKTKLIEAIALSKTVVSSRTGALGVIPEACGPKLRIVEDEDYRAYCDEIIRLQASPTLPTPASFYEQYYWGNIVEGVSE
jgi:glycosyltransferase involved in cell wall biosynthesis